MIDPFGHPRSPPSPTHTERSTERSTGPREADGSFAFGPGRWETDLLEAQHILRIRRFRVPMEVWWGGLVLVLLWSVGNTWPGVADVVGVGGLFCPIWGCDPCCFPGAFGRCAEFEPFSFAGARGGGFGFRAAGR